METDERKRVIATLVRIRETATAGLKRDGHWVHKQQLQLIVQDCDKQLKELKA